MGGAVAGLLFVHNDPKYRSAEFGGVRITEGRLRATAWTWAYSEQFEIGPVSEASIGNIQARYPEQGFVDHVNTPAFGFAWLVLEDALDRYVIKSIEARTRNPWIRSQARSWLNPARSWANMMGFQKPWARDTRPGVTYYDPGLWANASRRVPPRLERTPLRKLPFWKRTSGKLGH
jgi:hypothetical protein